MQNYSSGQRYLFKSSKNLCLTNFQFLFCYPHNCYLTGTICNVCGCLALVFDQRKASVLVCLSEWNMPRRNRGFNRSCAWTSGATWPRCRINYTLTVSSCPASSCPAPISHFPSLIRACLLYFQTNNILKRILHESQVPNLSQSRVYAYHFQDSS